MNLPQNCSNCEHYDDVFCTLPVPAKLIHGAIMEPEYVVCIMWVKKDAPDEPEADTTPKDQSTA